jgi:phosphoglycerate kinase
MASKVSIADVPDDELLGRHVLLRVDFNVPLVESSAGVEVGDTARIEATIPTIQYLLDSGARVVICSHLGRPRGKYEQPLSLKPVADVLNQLLGNDEVAVPLLPDCVGPEVRVAINNLPDGCAVLLENVRFHPGEAVNDDAFAQQLAEGFDTFVNEAFGSSHRGT